MTNAEPTPVCIHCGKPIRPTGMETVPWIHTETLVERCNA